MCEIMANQITCLIQNGIVCCWYIQWSYYYCCNLAEVCTSCPVTYILRIYQMFSLFFHQFFPLIFLSLISWKRKQISDWFKTLFLNLPLFARWRRNHNKHLFKNGRFGILDWWNYLMSPSILFSFSYSNYLQFKKIFWKFPILENVRFL